MKKPFPRTESCCSGLFRHLLEAVKWEALKTAIELGLFDVVSEWTSAETVAETLSTHAENTGHLMNALAAMGYLEKAGGRFRNSSEAEAFLTTGKETSIGGMLAYHESWFRPVLNGGMVERVCNGPVENAGDVADEAIWANAARMAANHQRCGRAQRIAACVSALPEFPSFARILDMGGGPGLMGIAVAGSHPSLRCVVFDRESVCRVADEFIAEYGMEERVETRSGDYMADPIGADYDFVMANYTLNFYRDRLDDIVSKVYRALKPGGIFMVTSDGLTEEKTAPLGMVVSWLPSALQGMDLAFEQGVISDAMIRAGFVSTQSQMLDEPTLEAFGAIEVTVARKAPTGDASVPRRD